MSEKLTTMGNQLRRFLDVAAGEGYVFDGIDAADLYMAFFGDGVTPPSIRELESASQAGGGEAVKVGAVRANFSPFYIMSNVRRIVPAYYNKQRANWVLAMDVFAVGSKSARKICWDAGIDPDGYAIISVSNGAAPSAGNGVAEGQS